jgi:hypothetical protein
MFKIAKIMAEFPKKRIHTIILECRHGWKFGGAVHNSDNIWGHIPFSSGVTLYSSKQISQSI